MYTPVQLLRVLVCGSCHVSHLLFCRRLLLRSCTVAMTAVSLLGTALQRRAAVHQAGLNGDAISPEDTAVCLPNSIAQIMQVGGVAMIKGHNAC